MLHVVIACACRLPQGHWQLGAGERGACPAGAAFELPRHPKENTALQRALQAAGAEQAWLPLQGALLCLRAAVCLIWTARLTQACHAGPAWRLPDIQGHA